MNAFGGSFLNFSINWVSLFKYGFQTVVANSKWACTNILYNLKQILLSRLMEDRFNTNKADSAFLTAEVTRVVYLRSVDRAMPKSFSTFFAGI